MARPTPQMLSSSAELEQENKKQSWKPFFHLVKSVKLPWILIVLCTVLDLMRGTLDLLFPQYTEEIYAGNFSSSLVFTVVLVVLGQALLRAVFQFASEYTTRKNLLCFQKYIWRRLSRLPVSYYETHEPRELISRTTEDTLSISEFLSFNVSTSISSIYIFIAAATAIVAYDWRLGLSQLISIPLCYIIGIISGRIYFMLNNRIQGRLSDMTRYFSAILPYITLAKLFGQEEREHGNGNTHIDQYFKTHMRNEATGLVITFANTVSGLIQSLVTIFVGLALIRDGSIDVSQWVAFYIYAGQLHSNFRALMNSWVSLKKTQGACARIAAATNAPTEENSGKLQIDTSQGGLVFHGVSFAYGKNNVLNNVSFSVEPKKVTAIVGPSGAGKSTILNLVEQFYIPSEGAITWAGKDAREYDLTAWRRNIGYIPQDSQLFSGTIRENITHGCVGEVSGEKLRRAAQQADILEYIESLPMGFDTEVGENGTKLSGGQKQRIAIARALLMESELLVLDEATSNLDVKSEFQIEQTIRELSKDHTVLMVAHRMETVKYADKIIVMEHSCVSAQGTHDELMRNSPLYRRLVDAQMDESAMQGGNM